MHSKKFKILTTVFISILMGLLAGFTAFAITDAEYELAAQLGLDWDSSVNGWIYTEDESKNDWVYNWNGGNVFCKWIKVPGASSYLFTLYKLNDSDSMSTILGPVQVTGNSKDVTQTIVKKGSGRYRYSIIPVEKSQSKTYDVIFEKPIYSATILELDDTEIKKIKLGRESTMDTSNITSDGWHQYPNNTWTYGKGNNTLAKNEWMTINGKIYRFDSKGYMLKGWQQINGNYYYFDATNGDLWVNGKTPDGYTVNAEGVRVNETTGTAVTGGSLNATVNITLEETGEDGTIRNCSLKSVSNANLVSWKFETPYENWMVGNPVRLYVTVSSVNNFPFGKNTKVTCGQATYKSFTGSDPITIELLYYPKLKLKAPSNITINESNVVSWHGSQHAKSYIFKIYSGGESKKEYNPTTTEQDIASDLDEYNDVQIGIKAIYPSSKNISTDIRKYYLDSDETKYYNLDEVKVDTRLTEGTFSKTLSKLSYVNEDGQKATGWQQIAGSWYCFGDDGYAKGPGWYQDKDSNWYYFNNEYKMVVGNVTENGKTYFMNDGSYPNVPYGAWVQ